MVHLTNITFHFRILHSIKKKYTLYLLGTTKYSRLDKFLI